MLNLQGSQLLMLVQAGALFGLIFVLWMGGLLFWSMKRRQREQAIEQRLDLHETAAGTDRVLRLWHEDDVATVTVRGGLTSKSLLARLQAAHKQANIAADPLQTLLGLAGAATLLAFAAFTFTGNVLLVLCAAAGPLLIYATLLKSRVRRRTQLFEKQLVHALDLASRSLRAGHPLLGSFHLIAEELDAPVSTVFADICQQHTLGIGLEDAVERVALNSTSEDMRLFATCIAIQVRSGGNLADMMDRLAFVMRERVRLSRRIRVLSAQTHFSKNILAALPVALFAIMNLANPEYAATLYTTEAGSMLLGIATACVILGIVVMTKMSQIKY
jgi:tight adherence protein B